MEALFGKLLAYEYKLIQQSHVKDTKKKKKWIVLKASSLKENHKEESSDDEDAQKLNLMVKKFGKFLNGSKENKFSKPSKKVKNNNNTFTSKTS